MNDFRKDKIYRIQFANGNQIDIVATNKTDAEELSVYYAEDRGIIVDKIVNCIRID